MFNRRTRFPQERFSAEQREKKITAMLDEIADQVETLVLNFNTLQAEVHLLLEDIQQASVGFEREYVTEDEDIAEKLNAKSSSRKKRK